MNEHTLPMALCTMAGSLGLLSAYDSSGNDSEDEVPGVRVQVKRSFDKECREQNNAKRHAGEINNKRLPPPTALLNLYQNTTPHDKPEDNPDEHGGRVRSFSHERGNWATYVFIAVDTSQAIESFRDVLVATSKPEFRVQPSEHLHISLTRTVILKHHWIGPITSSVQHIAQAHPRFPLCLGEVKVYCNEERSRTFIGVEVTAGQEELLKLTHKLDQCLADFKLPSFYEEASFHVTLAWCVGDHFDELSRELPRFQSSLQMFIYSHPLAWSVQVDKLNIRSGNKYYSYVLRA